MWRCNFTSVVLAGSALKNMDRLGSLSILPLAHAQRGKNDMAAALCMLEGRARAPGCCVWHTDNFSSVVRAGLLQHI